jgi:transcriptional regulator with XRE-family HTH domain
VERGDTEAEQVGHEAGAEQSTSRISTMAFGESLRALMQAGGLTYRRLAEATLELDGKGITHAHINMLANGHDKPSMRAMELIARACGVEPEYFAEYRLAAAMRELDPAEVGLEQALENLDARLGARRSASARARAAPQPRAQSRPAG